MSTVVNQAAEGPDEPEGLERLFALLYQDLYRSAAHAMARQAPGHTLQPTALVSEAYVRLLGGDQALFNDRKHFLLTASRAMRHAPSRR